MQKKANNLMMKLLLFILLCFSSISYWSCQTSPSYAEFIAKDRNYFAGIANGCDDLLNDPQTVLDGMASKINGSGDRKEWNLEVNNKEIPSVLQRLKPTTIKVIFDKKEGNYVWIMVGVSRPGYGITWKKSDSGDPNSPWELKAFAEDNGDVVYSEQKSVNTKQ